MQTAEKSLSQLIGDGYAVVVFSPAELRGAAPNQVMDALVHKGQEVIEVLAPMPTLYADQFNPTEAEVEYDEVLEAKALKGDCAAAYELGAREACLSMVTSLDAFPENAFDAYEAGFSAYAVA